MKAAAKQVSQNCSSYIREFVLHYLCLDDIAILWWWTAILLKLIRCEDFGGVSATGFNAQ